MNYKEIKDIMVHNLFEVAMVALLVIFAFVQLFFGQYFKLFFDKWLFIFFAVEIYKVFYYKDVYIALDGLKSDRLLRKCVIASPIMMLITHMYVYTNAIYIHDSIRWVSDWEPYSNCTDKWAAYFNNFFTLKFFMPWVSGLLSVLFMALAVYFLSKSIGYQDWLSVWVLSGVTATNSSIINGHIYSGGEHYFILALFIVALAIYTSLLKPHRVSAFILSSFLISLVSGLYGAYMPLYPSVIIALIMIEILKGEKSIQDIVRLGIWHASILLSGMIMYYSILKFSLWYGDTEVQSYMSEGELNNGMVTIIKNMVKLIPSAYKSYIMNFTGKDFYLPEFLECIRILLNCSLIFVLVFLIISRWKILKKDGRIVLLGILLIIWPLSMNLIHLLCFGNTHFLMIFAFCTPFLFIPRIWRYISPETECNTWYKKLNKANFVIMTALFIAGSILFANILYIHVNDMYLQGYSIATRILDRIETVDGFTGDEDVIVFGGVVFNDYFRDSVVVNNEFLNVASIAGNGLPNGFTYIGTEEVFLENVMNCSLDITSYVRSEQYCDEAHISADEKKHIENMKVFPFEGSVSKYGNRIYIKLSEEKE